MAQTSAREEILGNIRRTLHRDVNSNAMRRKRDGSASSKLDLSVSEIRQNCEQRRGELITQFESELAKIGARLHRARTFDSACQYVEQVASAHQARGLIGWHSSLIDCADLPARLASKGIRLVTEMNGALIQQAAAADIGLSTVDYALADTGTLILLARDGQPRSVSLLPPVHIAIVRPEQIISGLNDLFPLLRGEGAGSGLSSAVTFITGPSRTADIELTLVVGVHGPQELHVVLLES